MTFAAMDTTSNMLSQILHLLAQQPDVQERLRQEILRASSDGCPLSYDELHTLPFLDAVCRETLRLYVPIVSSLLHTLHQIQSMLIFIPIFSLAASHT